MKYTMSTVFQKSDSEYDKQIRTMVLSTDVNDYDTGEHIVDGSIRKTLINSSQITDNPIRSMLSGVKVGKKYCTPTASTNTITADQKLEYPDRRQSLLIIS
jgi:hypothetical protein